MWESRSPFCEHAKLIAVALVRFVAHLSFLGCYNNSMLMAGHAFSVPPPHRIVWHDRIPPETLASFCGLCFWRWTRVSPICAA